MSKLLEQVKALQDEAHTCPRCGGDGVLYGQMGYNGCATEYTCYRCNGTKRVPNPGVDKLVKMIEVLTEPFVASHKTNEVNTAIAVLEADRLVNDGLPGDGHV